MLLAISKRFGVPPVGIEIHPGGRNNTFLDLIDSIIVIRNRFGETFRETPFVVLENRTTQFVSNGEEINGFWRALSFEAPELSESVGVVLDIQQLYTVTGKNFLEQLDCIPHESVKGLHVHFKHRTPSLENEIPWGKVFSWLRQIKHKIFINPEVHHHSQAKDTISFCEARLSF